MHLKQSVFNFEISVVRASLSPMTWITRLTWLCKAFNSHDGHYHDSIHNTPISIIESKISPQWWSGRSTTAHVVFDLHSLVWTFGESCTIVRAITSQPASVFSYVLYRHFHQSLTLLLQLERGTFQPRVLEFGRCSVGDRLMWHLAHGFLLDPHWHV